jgi:hypothetical protein
VIEQLDALPPDARARLAGFSRAVERLHVDELPLYAVKPMQPAHQRAGERAVLVASQAGLTDAINAARTAVTTFIGNQYTAAQFRTSVLGMNTAPGLGPADDRVRVLRSIGDAIAAIVLWDALDEADRAELLGPWSNLVA